MESKIEKRYRRHFFSDRVSAGLRGSFQKGQTESVSSLDCGVLPKQALENCDLFPNKKLLRTVASRGVGPR